MVRRGGRRRHRRRADLVGGARGRAGDAREAQDRADLRRRPAPTSPARPARPMPRNGPTTPMRWRMSPAARWSSAAATPGSSSPPTTPSAMRWSATPPPSSKPPAARCSARSTCRSTRRISRPSCCRRRPPRRKIIGLANAGGDTINAIKQGAEFGIVEGGQKFAALLMFITDVHSLGLKTAQGLHAHRRPSTGIRTTRRRAWSKRFFERMHHMPTMVQAGVYSAVHALPQGGEGARQQGPATR